MTAPDPLRTVTDSARAFMDRLAFFADLATLREDYPTAYGVHHIVGLPKPAPVFIEPTSPFPEPTPSILDTPGPLHLIVVPTDVLDALAPDGVIPAEYVHRVDRNIAAVASTGLTEADIEGLTDRIAARVAHGYQDEAR